MSSTFPHFLRVFYDTGSFLGLTPSFDCEKSKVKNNVRDKAKSLLLAGLTLVGTIYSIFNRKIFYNVPATYMILDCVNEFFVISLIVLSIMGSSFHCRRFWSKLISNFEQTDKLDNVSCGFFRNAYFQLVIIHIVIFLSVAYNVYVWIYQQGVVVILKSYSVHEICFYYKIFLQLLMFNFATAFRHKYHSLNYFLEHNFAPRSASKKLTIKEFQNFSTILRGMVDAFNEIFGWPLIFMIGGTVVQLLVSLNFMISDLSTIYSDAFFRLNWLIANILVAALILVSISMVIMSCDGVVNEGGRMVALCCALRDEQPEESKEWKELDGLARHFKDNLPRFTAAKFYDINRSTLIGILANTTTYLIVVIQFNGTLKT